MRTKHYSRVLVAAVAVLLFTSVPLCAFAKQNIIKVSGEIASIDLMLGKLQLEADSSRNRRDPIEYRINTNDTHVTDPTDKKFLKLEDLQVGQKVTIEFKHIQGEWVDAPIAQKIVADPISAPVAKKAPLQGSTSTVTTTTTRTTTQ